MTGALDTQRSSGLEAPTDAAPAPTPAAADETRALRHAPSYVRFVGFAAAGLAFDLWSKHWAFHTLGQGNTPRVVIPHVLEFQTMLNPGALFGIGGGQTILFIVASAFALVLVFWMFAQTTVRRWSLHIALGAILAGALGNMYDRVTVKLLERPLPNNNHYVYTVESRGDGSGGTPSGESTEAGLLHKFNGGVLLEEYPVHDGGAQFRMSATADGGVIIRKLPRGGHVRLDARPREVGFVRDFIKIPTKIFGERDLWPWVFNVADMLLVCGVGLLAIHLWCDRKQGRQDGQIAVDEANAAA